MIRHIYLKSVMFGRNVTGNPISSKKKRCVGTLQACKHVCTQPLDSKNRHFSTNSPCRKAMVPSDNSKS